MESRGSRDFPDSIANTDYRVSSSSPDAIRNQVKSGIVSKLKRSILSLSFSKSLIIITILLFCFSFLGSIPVKAVSVVSSDVNASRVYSNQAQYAQCGIYYIFATNTKLLFYDSSGTLIKIWNTTITGSTYNGNYALSFLACTKIYAINSSYVLVFTGSIYETDTNHASVYYYAVLLNVDTLVTTVIINTSSAISFSSYPHPLVTGQFGIESVLVKQANYYYAIIGAYCIDNNGGTYGGTFLYRILPSWSIINESSGDLTHSWIRGSTVWLNSSSLYTIYYLTRDVWLGNE